MFNSIQTITTLKAVVLLGLITERLERAERTCECGYCEMEHLIMRARLA